MLYSLILIFLVSIQVCLAGPHLPDTVVTASDHLTMAKQFEAEGNSDQAIETYELAKTELAQQADDAGLVYVLNRLASLYMTDPSAHEKAQDYLDTANTIIAQRLYENDTLCALTWYTTAELAFEQFNHALALEYYKKSLQRKQAYYGKSHLEVAHTLEQIGALYLYDLQNPYASEPYYKTALEIRETLDDQSRFRTNCYYSLAVSNRSQGDYEEALAYGFKVLEDYKSFPDLSYSSYNIVAAYSLIGSIYYDMDSIKDALAYNIQAIKLAIREGLTESMDMSLHYNNHAGYYFQAAMYDSTIYYARLSIAHQSRSDYLASSYQFLGNAYLKEGALDSAFLNYQKSKSIKESIFDAPHTQLAILYLDIAHAFDAKHQSDSALYYYQKAIKNARISQSNTELDAGISIQEGDDLTTLQEAFTGMIDLLIKQYDQTQNSQYLSQAQQYFQLFDHLTDLSRTHLSVEGSKLILSGNHKATYEKAIATYYHMYQISPADSLLEQIFHFMEKSKSMVLLESIHQAQRYQRVLPDSLVQEDQSLRAQLAYCQAELLTAEQQASNTSLISEWQLRKADVLRSMELLNQHIQTHFPNYYNISFRNITISLDSIQKHLEDEQFIVSYFWGDSAVYALAITSTSIKVHQVRDVEALRQAIAQYQQVLVEDNVIEPSYTHYLQFQETAFKLYQSLLSPLLAENTFEHLILIPDGELTTIPFESFITSNVRNKDDVVQYKSLPYLIKDYEVSYEFSLSVAFWEKQFADHKELTVAAFGIKTFDQLPGDQHYPPLAGAEREVKYILDKFPQASIFLNAEATEAQFKQQAPQADILHIATHGMADLKNPFASRFIFYPEGKEDGVFNLYELYNMPLKAKVLLLSACESGVGRHYKGEGNFSLARSFVYAGSKSVVMSLWQVNDIITEQLIKSIYDQLADEQTTSASLRKTKIAFIEEGLYAHPQCWAGMVPLGNTHISLSQPYPPYYMLIGLALLATGSIYFGVKFLQPKQKKYSPSY